jgi:hypothetical protein
MLPLNARTVFCGMVLVACLVSAALALPGCQPAGVGSIKVGSPGKWHKAPVAPESRKVPRNRQKGPPAGQAPYKSIKDEIKERSSS